VDGEGKTDKRGVTEFPYLVHNCLFKLYLELVGIRCISRRSRNVFGDKFPKQKTSFTMWMAETVALFRVEKVQVTFRRRGLHGLYVQNRALDPS